MKTNNSGKNGFRKRTVHNLIILDESGSMESIKQATITGFNEVVQTIKGVEKQFPEQKHYVSLVTFNGLGIKTRLFAEKVKTLREIDEKSFQPDSMTPLYDAIGFSVNKLQREIEGVEQDRRGDRTEHVERAVREVHHAEHAEDDGQAEGRQRVEAAGGQALDRVLK